MVVIHERCRVGGRSGDHHRGRTNAIEIVTSESNSDALAELGASGNGRLTSITDPAALSELYQEIASPSGRAIRVSFTSQTAGSADYTLTLNSTFGPLSASTSVELPEAPAPSTGSSSSTDRSDVNVDSHQ